MKILHRKRTGGARELGEREFSIPRRPTFFLPLTVRSSIWEKKYGRNANHMKKEQEISAKGPSGQGRGNARPWLDKAQDKSRPGPPPDLSRASQPLSRPPTCVSLFVLPMTYIVLIVAIAPAMHRIQQMEDKPLHPSWEAKKKLKEKQNPGIVASQGKKTVF